MSYVTLVSYIYKFHVLTIQSKSVFNVHSKGPSRVTQITPMFCTYDIHYADMHSLVLLLECVVRHFTFVLTANLCWFFISTYCVHPSRTTSQFSFDFFQTYATSFRYEKYDK